MSKRLVNVFHWLSLGTGVVMAGAAVLAGDPKLGTAAVAVVSVAQTLHKVFDVLDK